VRQAFYGEEVQRIQRDSDTVKVMVRFPFEARRSISTLEDMHIRTAAGEAIAIGEVADIRLGVGLTAIDRLDRKRTVTVTAEVEANKIESGDVVRDVKANLVPELLEKYPSVEFRLSGGTRETNEYYIKMAAALLAGCCMIYGLLAVPLRSYVQPVVIMSVIPFGFIGAVFGHMLFGVSINILSSLGIVALAGVVVNDSLILVEFANRGRAEGLSNLEAILNAGKRRFRAILLTTLTTFVGLFPILFETSVQAQFVIPMALSLSFGILFASVITLVLIPCLYLIVESNHRFVSALLLIVLLVAICCLMVFIDVMSTPIFIVIAVVAVLAAVGLFGAKVAGYVPENNDALLG
jgi:multidrug efflux pump subunit AcrB